MISFMRLYVRQYTHGVIFSEYFIENVLIIRIRWCMKRECLHGFFCLREPVESIHDEKNRRDEECPEYRKKIEFDPHRHTDNHGKEDKSDVTRLLNIISEANYRECTHHREGTSDIRSDDEHDDGHDHRHDDERLDIALRVSFSFVRLFINPSDKTSEDKRTEYNKENIYGRNACVRDTCEESGKVVHMRRLKKLCKRKAVVIL